MPDVLPAARHLRAGEDAEAIFKSDENRWAIVKEGIKTKSRSSCHTRTTEPCTVAPRYAGAP
jgi:hypothetical protein